MLLQPRSDAVEFWPAKLIGLLMRQKMECESQPLFLSIGKCKRKVNCGASACRLVCRSFRAPKKIYAFFKSLRAVLRQGPWDVPNPINTPKGTAATFLKTSQVSYYASDSPYIFEPTYLSPALWPIVIIPTPPGRLNNVHPQGRRLEDRIVRSWRGRRLPAVMFHRL